MSRLSIYFLGGAAAILFAANVGRAQALNPIGINIAADGNSTPGASTGEQPEQEADNNDGTPPQSGTAGVDPILNWNNLIITRFKTNSQLGGQNVSSANLPLPQLIPSSPMPFTSAGLLDSSGAAVAGAQVTAWTGGDTYSVYNGATPQTRTNNDAQLVNGLLGTQNNPTGTGDIPSSVTVALPASYVAAGYNVYVYFNDNEASTKGTSGMYSGLWQGQYANISLTSGVYASPTYYELTEGSGFTGPTSTSTAPFNNGSAGNGIVVSGNQTIIASSTGIYTYTDGSGDNSLTNLAGWGGAGTLGSSYGGPYTASESANYVNIPVLPGVGGSSFTVDLYEPVTSGLGSGNPGITAIEIVPDAVVSVPEPASLALMLLGAVPAGLLLRQRKAA